MDEIISIFLTQAEIDYELYNFERMYLKVWFEILELF